MGKFLCFNFVDSKKYAWNLILCDKHGKILLGSTWCYLYDILEFVAQVKQGKIPFDSFFIVVIITELMMESRKFVKALKYMHFFDKKF